MAKHRPSQIQRELLGSFQMWRESPVAQIANKFHITRQAVQRHLKKLVDSSVLETRGVAPHRQYRIKVQSRNQATVRLRPKPAEDQIWSQQIRQAIGELDFNSLEICNYGATEILNNAIDHSGGDQVRIIVERSSVSVRISIEDNGVGIFQKVSDAMRLTDVKDAPLELSKGKFTTDPKRHTGEGIFFTSRAFNQITIASNTIWFVYEHRDSRPLWIVSEDVTEGAVPKRGTLVELLLWIPAERRLEDLFSEYSSGPEDYRFAKTRVPVKLAALSESGLISRSAAKRLLARIDRFDQVHLDFEGVNMIGQGFADEIFRVFARAHPAVQLIPLNANRQVNAMIRRAQSSHVK